MEALLTCDTVIYNISDSTDDMEEALWVVQELHEKISTFATVKVFVCISTILTWAKTKPLNPVSYVLLSPSLSLLLIFLLSLWPWEGSEWPFFILRFLFLQDEPDVPFTEEDYRRRRTHPNFKEHITIEKEVIKMGKTVSDEHNDLRHTQWMVSL